jgi:type III secretion protein C
MNRLTHFLRCWFCFALRVLPALVLPPAGHAAASSDEWLEQPYPYLVVSQDIRAALQEFSYQLNRPVQISERIQGTLQGVASGGRARDFLDRAAAAGHAGWYSDGNVIIVRTTGEMVLRRFDMRRLDAQARQRLLQDSQPVGRQVSLAYDPAHGEMTAYGPIEFVDTIARRVELGSGSPPPRPAPVPGPVHAVQIFRFHSGN